MPANTNISDIAMVSSPQGLYTNEGKCIPGKSNGKPGGTEVTENDESTKLWTTSDFFARVIYK